MPAKNTNHDQDSIDPVAVAFIVGGVILAAVFVGIVRGIVSLFQALMPFLLCFFGFVFLVLAVVLMFLVIAGIRQAWKGKLGSSIGEFSRGLRGMPKDPCLTYNPTTPASDPYTIDALPRSPGPAGTTTTFAPTEPTFREDPPPDPSSDPLSPSEEANAILLLRADIMDSYVLHIDRIAKIYPYEKFLAEIDSTLCFFSESYRCRLDKVRARITLAVTIAMIIDLREEAVAAYNRAPHAIRDKLPKHIVREHILTVYQKHFALDLIKKRHRALLQKIESVSLQVKEAAAKNPQPAKQPDPRAQKKKRERAQLEEACRVQAEENVRRALPSTARELVDDLVDEEKKRLLRNALEQRQQGDSDDRNSKDTDNLAA